jgi:hypothetical protein
VAIARLRASSRSGIAFSVVAKLGVEGVEVRFSDRFTGPANGRASERASCVVAGRAAERDACEWDDCVPPRPATFFASFGSFLKNENTTCQFLASSVVGEAMEQPAAAQRTQTVVDKSTVEASSSAPHTA